MGKQLGHLKWTLRTRQTGHPVPQPWSWPTSSTAGLPTGSACGMAEGREMHDPGLQRTAHWGATGRSQGGGNMHATTKLTHQIQSWKYPPKEMCARKQREARRIPLSKISSAWKDIIKSRKEVVPPSPLLGWDACFSSWTQTSYKKKKKKKKLPIQLQNLQALWNRNLLNIVDDWHGQN